MEVSEQDVAWFREIGIKVEGAPAPRREMAMLLLPEPETKVKDVLTSAGVLVLVLIGMGVVWGVCVYVVRALAQLF